jgi:hypothetical protein
MLKLLQCFEVTIRTYQYKAEKIASMTDYGKMTQIFDILNLKFLELHHSTVHMALDEVTIKFKGKVIFSQCIPKTHKRFGIKIYKLCDNLVTYTTRVYALGNRNLTNTDVILTHGIVLLLVQKGEAVGYKIIHGQLLQLTETFQ